MEKIKIKTFEVIDQDGKHGEKFKRNRKIMQWRLRASGNIKIICLQVEAICEEKYLFYYRKRNFFDLYQNIGSMNNIVNIVKH